MVRRSLPLALGVAVLAASVPGAVAAATDKDVNVVNTPSVNVVNTPTVQLSPGASLAATQAGPWAVSVLPTPPAARGTFSLGAPGTSGAIGPSPVFTVSFGLTNTTTTTSGGGAGAGKASFRELVVTRTLDASSPALFLAAAEGRVFATASVVMTDASGNPVATFDLQNVAVSSLVSGTDGSAKPMETVGLTFEKITEQIGGAIAGWDVLANARL
ncbi:MAG TPA: type VI secretion system tube protein Hcp [Anaeromyxobacter sp.]